MIDQPIIMTHSLFSTFFLPLFLIMLSCHIFSPYILLHCIRLWLWKDLFFYFFFFQWVKLQLHHISDVTKDTFVCH